MILYDTDAWYGYKHLFRCHGSAIFSWRTMPNAVISGFICSFAVYEAEYIRRHSSPPIYFQSLLVVLTILLIFRCQMAYERYWEGRSFVQVIISKLEDASTHVKFFVHSEEPTALIWKYNMSHMLIAYVALMWADFQEASLGKEDIFELTRRYNLKLQKRCLDELRNPKNRVEKLNAMIINSWVEAEVNGLVAVAPPILSRTFHVMSEINASYNEALIVATTPFPFPFMQVCAFLLHVYMLTGPIIIGAYVHSYYLGVILASLSVLGLFSLNHTCEEMEDPFGDDPNDLPLGDLLEEFQESLFYLGLVTMPAKARWFQLKLLVPILSAHRDRQKYDESKRLSLLTSNREDNKSGGGSPSKRRRRSSLLSKRLKLPNIPITLRSARNRKVTLSPTTKMLFSTPTFRSLSIAKPKTTRTSSGKLDLSGFKSQPPNIAEVFSKNKKIENVIDWKSIQMDLLEVDASSFFQLEEVDTEEEEISNRQIPKVSQVQDLEDQDQDQDRLEIEEERNLKC
mmetsp:Transcript_9591/g.13029  ORF Transcript_9591/g.13029 Transcript_9591/m.13029 type:complete len:512 (+) Transcript_9591:107-1642(+)